MQTGVATVENRSEVLQKITKLTYDPAIPFGGIFPKESKSGIQEEFAPPVHCSTIRNSQGVETT